MKITLVAGARPNFMKISPIVREIERRKALGAEIEYRLIHTGQHFDTKMSSVFFEQLGIPEPHSNLEAGGGSQAEQTAAIMVRFEKELLENRPDVVLVVGDVTSTMACTITARKLCIDSVHVEAGIRSGDMTMPEEINRIVTDSISNHFFTTSEFANDLLRSSGFDSGMIHFVGNTMIDTLLFNLDKLVEPAFFREQNLDSGDYILMTLHRPANVDDSANLQYLIDQIVKNCGSAKIVFPVHPRTRKVLDTLGIQFPNLVLTEPLPYLEFIYLIKNAKGIITDSGGITEEATVLGVPCMTMRNSTERPETVTMGSNVLVGTDPDKLKPYLDTLMKNEWKKSAVPPLWDGKTAERIVSKLLELYA
jgi:UDP-N-acetylglucosamine 2-epimerase (non-hydrolysing)